MRVVDVRKSRDDHANHMVLLEDAEGGHRLPIFIGRPEAWALTFALEGIHLPRPLVYHFLLRSLEAVGAKLSEVRIEQVVERTYYAVAVYEGGGEPRDVDARPSDALNLAVLAGVPIRMRRAVWESGREKTRESWQRWKRRFPIEDGLSFPIPSHQKRAMRGATVPLRPARIRQMDDACGLRRAEGVG